jgi:hypothetical protein
MHEVEEWCAPGLDGHEQPSRLQDAGDFPQRRRKILVQLRQVVQPALDDRDVDRTACDGNPPAVRYGALRGTFVGTEQSRRQVQLDDP